ncbi:MAG: diaminopimelate decarboxylase [Alphaproteobacteria bacterium]|nr:diaminopimelate decarboxylase [Alphaproteobacteria bacterium]
MSNPDALPGAPDLAYRDGALVMEEVAVAGMAERVGTPFYAYSSAYLERRYRAFMAAFGGEALLCFAVKANSNLGVLRHLGRLGAGADLVSEGELRRALAAAIPPHRLIFSGVGKTEAELSAALAAGVHQINVESEAELTLLSEVARRVGRTARIAIRVNPDVDANTHDKISTGRSGDKFGIDLALAPEALRRAKELPRIEPVGLAVHIGSQITSLEPFETAFSRVVDLLKALRREGIALTRLDLGGGLGIRYKDETPPSVEDYAALVKRLTRGLGLQLAFEQGRWVAANAGILVSRVLSVKESIARRFVIVDAAMNDLIRPALYGAWHEIVPVAAADGKAQREVVDVVGPVCETGDVFAAGRPLPPLAAGDLVAFLSAGAYGAIMSSGYNSRLLVPEVMVRGGEFAIVRPRPTYDEMLAQERVPLWLL